jgi:tripeptidyl-peptidase-1
MRKYRSDGADATVAVVQVNYGWYDPSKPNEEANLDLQYAQGIAYPIPHVFYSTGRGLSGSDDWYLSWLGSVINLLSLPQTISMSYSQQEYLYLKDYAEYVCYLFALLGARGVSVLFSTGDHGVGIECVTIDGSIRFSPHFPATCPFITAVGGTTRYLPEVAADFSGGGFSDHFQRPDYQQQVASTFLKGLGNLYQGQFRDTGRGIPDIAAQSTGFRIFNNSIEIAAGGTSGSTPVGVFPGLRVPR